MSCRANSRVSRSLRSPGSRFSLRICASLTPFSHQAQIWPEMTGSGPRQVLGLFLPRMCKTFKTLLAQGWLDGSATLHSAMQLSTPSRTTCAMPESAMRA